MSKSKIYLKSIFEQISEQVFNCSDLQEAKEIISNFVNEKRINNVDKTIILIQVDKCKTLLRLQGYICNSLLKYEGMGISN